MSEQIRGALHTGVKRALAVVSSHYSGVDLNAITDGYVATRNDEGDDDDAADEELLRLIEAAEAPGFVLAARLEAEVVLHPADL